MISGDIFDNYCDDDILMSIGRALFLVSILLTYPIGVFVIRAVIIVYVYHSKIKCLYTTSINVYIFSFFVKIIEETVFPNVKAAPQTYPLYIHIPLTFLIVGAALGISFGVSCLSLVSEITVSVPFGCI